MSEIATKETETKTEPINLHNMSDDEFSNLDPSDLDGLIPVETQEEKTATKTVAEEDNVDDTGGADATKESEAASTEGAVPTSDDLNLDLGNDERTEEQQATSTEADQATETDETASAATDESTDEVDTAAELAKVFAPFKADKKTIQVKNAEEARILMQFGANYSRKMEEMKPYRQMLKTLENNDLLDGDKINFLIDLHKKVPAAMKKFFKDSGLDPHDLSYEDDSPDYKPNDHLVPQQELDLDEVLDSIRDTPSFARTAKILQDDWDMASKRILLDNPGAIRVINDHIASGAFDQIDEVMATERALGRLEGLSDLEAYRKIGDAMYEAGKFANQKTPAPTGSTTQDSEQTNSGSETEAERKARKRAAATTTGAASAGKPRPNFLSMPDDELEKFDVNSL
jgi:hypothetical protein